MTAHPGTLANRTSKRTLIVAVAISVSLHVLLWLGFRQLRHASDTPHETDLTPISCIFLEVGGNDKKAKGVGEEQSFDVKVDAPSLPTSNVGEAGPAVRIRGHVAHHGQSGVGIGRGTAKFFQMPISAGRVVFVVDRSLSMGRNGALTLARRELMNCLNSLSDDSLFQVVLYNREAEPLPGGMLTISESSLRCVEEVLAKTRPSGATDHIRAVRCALNLQPQAIFLVTDADDMTAIQAQQIESINRERVVIHTINVGRSVSATGMLQQLARASGGQYLQFTGPR